ncbi:unnamed protein product [Peniophora sp. CBMAI 1063]|nr:unnamed protein product [Peniophora sp. CBMAI 1063]
MSDEKYTKDALSSLASTVVDKAPYFGSLPLHIDSFKLFFDDKNGEGRSIHTATATHDQLNALAAACSVAPFGRGAEAVVDDTYRRAGKLDLPNFATPFDPAATSLVAGIKESVLEGKASNRPIRFELYKLNVYGEGGFFKTHKDTPRGSKMFGSLVLVYPTAHTGGALVFRHQDREWTFDSASAVTRDGAPAFGYAAFYSDVEHEVLPVTSGYRVTITYNLYFDDVDDDSQSGIASADSLDNSAFRTQLATLLDDAKFLPKGGYLGFGLRHSYPIEFAEGLWPKRNGVQHLLDVLRGADASVLRAARAAGLSTQIHVAYDTQVEGRSKMHDVTVLTTEVVGGELTYSDFCYFLEKRFHGVPLYPPGHKKCGVGRAVHWVTPHMGGSRFKSVYLAYGNEPSLQYEYAELCLLVAVGPHGERTMKGNLEQVKGESNGWSSDEDDFDERVVYEDSEEDEGDGEE